jgi:hypothetical protein
MIRDAVTLIRWRWSAKARRCPRTALPLSRSKRFDICGRARIRWCSSDGYYPPFERGGEADGWPLTYLSGATACAPNRRSRADWHSFFRVLRLRRSELGLSNFRLDLWTRYVDNKVGGSRSDVGVGSELDRSRPGTVPGARRQTHSVPRIQRPGSAADDEYQLLRERCELFRRIIGANSAANSGRDAGFLPALHGTWHEPLQGRPRRKCIRHAHPACPLG